MDFYHKPVLVQETLAALSPLPGEVFVDGTVGGAGHSSEIAERIMPQGLLVAIDRDEDALQAAKLKLAPYSQNIKFVKGNFRDIRRILEELNVPAVDGILLDVGVSSYQLDEPERGFSFHNEAPLDMRMDSSAEKTAADLVNELDAPQLASIIKKYGEEKWAGRIARTIVARREKNGPLQTTGDLVEAIKNAIPAPARRKGGHPARRTFQALRIAVNDELGALDKGIRDGISCLKVGGRLAVITFHSLEDRIVKKIFKEAATGCQCPPRFPQCVCGKQPQAELLTAKAIAADDEEIISNPRARSAKMRALRVLNIGKGE